MGRIETSRKPSRGAPPCTLTYPDLNACGVADRKPRCLGSFVAGYKAAVTKRVNSMRGTPGAALWQRNYYERVIRTEAELRSVREYIALNTLAWEHDEDNPGRT